MGCLCLQVDSVCLGHTLAPRNLLCNVHKAPKLHFAHIWSFSNFDFWPLHLKFSKMLNTVPISVFIWYKVATWNNTVITPKPFLPIFWSSDDLHFWPSNFQKYLPLLQLHVSCWKSLEKAAKNIITQWLLNYTALISNLASNPLSCS